MRRVSICYARTHLADLVDQANAGQAVVITRRGCVVARIVPAVQVAGPLPSRAAVRSAMIKRGAKVTGTTVATMRAEARW